MQGATRVKSCPATGALIGVEVSLYAHFVRTGPTPYRNLIELAPRPLVGRVITHGFVTTNTGIIGFAAFHFNSYNIRGPVIMGTAPLRIELYTVDRDLRSEI